MQRYLRFSLRTLLLLTICAALAAWYATRVHRTATSLVHAIEAGDADAVERHFPRRAQGQLLASRLGSGFKSGKAHIVDAEHVRWWTRRCQVEAEVVELLQDGSRLTVFQLNVNPAGAHLEAYHDSFAIVP